MTTEEATQAPHAAMAVADAFDDAASLAQRLVANLASVVLGTDEALVTAVTALLAGGHLLVEDVPGVGKTMLAKALAASVQCRLARIQGHPDLLPSDVTGVTVFVRETGTFEFRPGPVFAHILLFDELNRTPPRSQASLLEAMEEGQVSIDGETWPLPHPHFVVATQNPVALAGTYPLVESQMDRFIASTRLGYPNAVTELRLAQGAGARPALDALSPVCSPAELASAQRATATVHVPEAVARYAVSLVRATREAPGVLLGASPRASVSLVASARAHAVLAGRRFATPGDVKDAAICCLAHRLVTEADPTSALGVGTTIVASLLEAVPTPRP